MTHRQYDRRIRRLEAASSNTGTHEPLVVLVESGDRNPELGRDERVVIDQFRFVGGAMWGRERVTSIASDSGRRCTTAAYLPDVLAEVHAQCPWREKYGFCRICKGILMANLADGSGERQKAA